MTTALIKHKNLVAQLLADKRSENTKRAYKKDLEDFFSTLSKEPMTQDLVHWFLNLDRFQATAMVYQYKANLLERGLKEATVNRRLAAIRSLASYAYGVGACDWNLAYVRGEKVETYRDTSGIPVNKVAAILNVPNRLTLKGKRDYAMLRLLWDNALRRGEIVKTNIQDFDSEAQTLLILGKGKGSQKEKISLSAKTAQAIQEWLNAREEVNPSAPLFISLDRAHKEHRLTGESVALIVKKTAIAAGITKKMSPHRLRHSSITAALEATNGNVIMVQKLSRHAKVETLLIYNDQRTNLQKQVTELLSNII
ncbi:MAG: tyrosine-type recombinase/integrase [Carboxydocellales bacterium]